MERLETDMAATSSRIVQLVDQRAQRWQRRKRILSLSSRGTGISPASKKVTPRPDVVYTLFHTPIL